MWLFAAFLLAQYALNERARFERDALQVSRQASLAVEAELDNLAASLESLLRSQSSGSLEALRAEAGRLVEHTDRTVMLGDRSGRLIFDTSPQAGAGALPFAALSPSDLARLDAGRPVVTGVYADPVTRDHRIAVALPFVGPRGEAWLVAVAVPTAAIRDAMLPAVPPEWVTAVGDRTGAYVARSSGHEETTGRPGLPEYIEKVVGRSGTFTARNLQGLTLLAGYYRSDASGWFYTANVPLSVVQAPLWRSLAAIGAIGLVAMLVSAGLAYGMGKGFSRAAAGLAARAAALGRGAAVAPLKTSVAEFGVIAEALTGAGRTLAERAHELETVLETAPAAVWFTYDPEARRVIRNRFAAELMGLPADDRKAFGAPDLVIDTAASKDGRPVGREDRPLSRAMRGERTDNEEFAYTLLDGTERILLSSARPIRDDAGATVGAVQVSLDITERKRGEKQRELLVNELNHRVKNTLAVVQSIASQTLRSAPSLAEAGRAITGRLVSLGKAHDILTQRNWSGAEVEEVVVASVTSPAGLERFRLDGGAAWLRPSLALSLSLALHELATNAIKYGALSVPGGRVAVAWSLSGPERRRLRLEWRESGGPPIGPAARRGFGTRLLERILEGEPSGRVSVAFEAAGVVCVFEVDLCLEDGKQPS